MIYLLYGKDTYRSKQNAQDIVRRFTAKNAPHHFFRITPDTFQENIFFNLTRTDAMFGGKYVVLFECILVDSALQKFIFDALPLLKSSQNIFIFWEEDMPAEITEKLRLHAKQIQEFSPLVGAELKNWIIAEGKKISFLVSNDALGDLIRQHGSDTWTLRNKLEMLSLGHHGAAKTASFEGGIPPMFDLTDAVAARNKERALMVFEKYKNAGIPASEILWRLLWQVRTLCVIKKLSPDTPHALQKKTGLHSFIVKKSLASIARFSRKELESLFRLLLDAHHQSKMDFVEIDERIFHLLLTRLTP